MAGNKRHNLLVKYRKPVLILKLRCVTDALAYCVTLNIGFEIAPCKIFMCMQHMFCIHLVYRLLECQKPFKGRKQKRAQKSKI